MTERIHFKGRYLTMVTEEKDGQTLERAYSRNGVTVLIIPRAGVLRFVTGTNWKNPTRGPMVLSAYLEEGEDPLVCAKRELAEELGATAATWRHYMTSRWKGTLVKTQEYYIAEDITQGKATPDSDEDIDGFIDLTYPEVRQKTLELAFGTNENAFALLKFLAESGM